MRELKSQYTVSTVFPHHLFCSIIKNASMSFWKYFLRIFNTYIYMFLRPWSLFLRGYHSWGWSKSASLRALSASHACQWNADVSRRACPGTRGWASPCCCLGSVLSLHCLHRVGVSYPFCQRHFCMTSGRQKGSRTGSSPVFSPPSHGSKCTSQVRSFQY